MTSEQKRQVFWTIEHLSRGSNMKRPNWFQVSSEGGKAMGAIHHYATTATNLPAELVHLVFLRYSRVYPAAIQRRRDRPCPRRAAPRGQQDIFFLARESSVYQCHVILRQLRRNTVSLHQWVFVKTTAWQSMAYCSGSAPFTAQRAGIGDFPCSPFAVFVH